MICADFVAGANLQDGDPKAFFLSVSRLVGGLSVVQRQQVLEQIGVTL